MDKKAILALLIGIPVILYIGLIYGKPDNSKFQNEIFPRFIDSIYTKVYDSKRNLIGGISTNQHKEHIQGTFYVEKVPKLFWEILKSREEKYLDFNNSDYGLKGILANPRCWNGIDFIGIPSALIHLRGGSTLTQQLIKNFYGQDYFRDLTPFKVVNKGYRKLKELFEAKTFFHNLRADDGEEFKRWLAMYPPSLNSAGSVYGIESVSAVVFGKKPNNLTATEQVLLTEMYKYSYYFKGKAHDRKCRFIKKGAIGDINRYFKDNPKRAKRLVKEVERWHCPTHPKLPVFMYSRLYKDYKKGIGDLGNPNNRIWRYTASMALMVRDSLKEFKEKMKDVLITEVKTTLDANHNIKFKNMINRTLATIQKRLSKKLIKDLRKDKDINIYIGVVDSYGSFVRVYRKGDVSSERRIGSISKVFEAIALGKRGESSNDFYCNEYFQGLHNYDGSQGGECKGDNLIPIKKVFGESLNLPLHSAFKHYFIWDYEIDKPISNRLIDKIYKEFKLSRDSKKIDYSYEMSFGLTNSSPLNLQKAIHKIAYELYYHKYRKYCDTHIIEHLKYKNINFEESRVYGGGVLYPSELYCHKLDTKLFNSRNRKFMKELFLEPLNKRYGTLRSFNSIRGYRPLFLKSGTTDKNINGKTLTQAKWVVGGFMIGYKPYSFVIMIHSENGIGEHIKHSEVSYPIFKTIVKSLR